MERENFQKDRETLPSITANPPHHDLKKPSLQAKLLENAVKSTSQPTLKALSLETIASYPEDIIHAYTDGSAVKATQNGGYGSIIYVPNRESIKLSGPCGSHCSNYEAELVAIQETLDTISKLFEQDSVEPNDIVIFSDSQSAIRALEDTQDKVCQRTEEIIATCDKIIRLYGTHICLQWIPGHCDIYNNEKADKLAKAGSRK